MANTNVPTQLRLVSIEGDEVRVAWTAPVARGYTWRVYADLTGTPPIGNPPLNSDPFTAQQFRFNLADVVGNSPPYSDLWVAVTSVNEINGQESAQSNILAVNVDAGDPAKPNHVTVGRSPTGEPTYLATDADGRLLAASGGGALATEPKQDVQIGLETTIAGDTTSLDAKVPAQGQAAMAASLPVVIASDQTPVDILNLLTGSPGPVAVPVAGGGGAVALPTTPLAGRKAVLLMNVGTTDCTLGVGGATNIWPMIKNQPYYFDAGPGVTFSATRATGSGNVLVWEFS